MLDSEKGHIRIALLGIQPKRAGYVKRALNRIWNFSEWKYQDYELHGQGEDWILRDMDDTLQEMAKAAVRNNKGGVHIEVYVQTLITKVKRWEA